MEAFKKSNEEMRTMNTRYAKENEKFREKYTELDARIRDFENQNEQLHKDNENFIERLEEMHVISKIFLNDSINVRNNLLKESQSLIKKNNRLKNLEIRTFIYKTLDQFMIIESVH